MRLDDTLAQALDKPWAEEIKRVLLTYAVPVGGKIVGAILLWIIGRIVIGSLQKVTRNNLEKRKLDTTLVRYVNSILGVAMTLLLLIAILSLFGVETASFAGVLAAAGVAIGMAWSGLLSNFAAGVFLIILRPFKVGDMITAAGITGVVAEVGLFASAIDTADNIRNFVGNAKIFGDTIQNYTHNDFRRVDLKAQLAHGVDPFDAMKRLRERLPKIEHVVKKPAPDVEILDFTASGPVLAVRPYCHNEHYWAVYFATNAAIVEEFTKAGYPTPKEPHFIEMAAKAAEKG
ncbi:MAG: mechanosensitive ion channel family protein [Byssovorax sp.]